mmetsp:Transcript_65333/g.155817  ORF Transcript_65333/g.155817 Transcript_65333/m.155817 type:complete len:439 (+) Transcript_65333:722-2038(+)
MASYSLGSDTLVASTSADTSLRSSWLCESTPVVVPSSPAATSTSSDCAAPPFASTDAGYLGCSGGRKSPLLYNACSSRTIAACILSSATPDLPGETAGTPDLPGESEARWRALSAEMAPRRRFSRVCLLLASSSRFFAASRAASWDAPDARGEAPPSERTGASCSSTLFSFAASDAPPQCAWAWTTLASSSADASSCSAVFRPAASSVTVPWLSSIAARDCSTVDTSESLRWMSRVARTPRASSFFLPRSSARDCAVAISSSACASCSASVALAIPESSRAAAFGTCVSFCESEFPTACIFTPSASRASLRARSLRCRLRIVRSSSACFETWALRSPAASWRAAGARGSSCCFSSSTVASSVACLASSARSVRVTLARVRAAECCATAWVTVASRASSSRRSFCSWASARVMPLARFSLRGLLCHCSSESSFSLSWRV